MFRLLASVALVAMLVACGSDPEAQSGADASRGGAEPIPLDDVVVDSISNSDGDMTDWKSVEIPGPGPVTLSLAADKPDAEIKFGLYDAFGKALGEGQRKAEQGPVKVVAVVPEEGTYFVMVQATDGDTTDYTLEVMLGAEGEGPGRPDF